MTLNKHIERTSAQSEIGRESAVFARRAVAAFAIVGTLGLGAWGGMAAASADPQGMINLTEVPDIDSLPGCALEDGSDSASLPCVWVNDGNTWLTYSDHSVLVVDDTVR